MKYLLLVTLIGFFSWPYYHRMRSFGWTPAKSYIIGLAPSILIGLGLTRYIVTVSTGGAYPVFPDKLTLATFVVVCIMATGWLTWLMFSSEWANSGPAGDGEFFLAIIMFGICVAQAFFITDVIVKIVMVLS